jgi:hypothetical protein
MGGMNTTKIRVACHRWLNKIWQKPEGANYETLWERVVVPTIQLKYINMKCNLNNETKDAYRSE